MAEIPLVLLIGPIVAGFSLIIVWLIMAYINPARGSPAWVFIKAKKKRAIVFLMDCGSYWKIFLGKNEGPGFAEDDEGSKIDMAPNSIKPCITVRVGVGEYHRSLTSNPLIMKIIEKAKEKKLSAKDLKDTILEFEAEKKEIPVEYEKETKELLQETAAKENAADSQEGEYSETGEIGESENSENEREETQGRGDS